MILANLFATTILVAPPVRAIVLPTAASNVQAGGPAQDVYLVAGQSNCEGQVQIEHSDAASRMDQPDGSIYLWGRRQGEQFDDWTDQTSLHEWQGVRQHYKSHTSFGPELSFGYDLSTSLSRPIGIVKTAVFETSLAEDWKPCGRAECNVACDGGLRHRSMFQWFLNRSFSALLACPRCKLKGLVWVQGETDCLHDASAENYKDNLGAFVDTVRDIFEVPDLFVLVAGLHPGYVAQHPFCEKVLQAQQNFVGEQGPRRAGFVDAAGLSKLGDNLHYDAKGQVELGRRLASELLKDKHGLFAKTHTLRALHNRRATHHSWTTAGFQESTVPRSHESDDQSLFSYAANSSVVKDRCCSILRDYPSIIPEQTWGSFDSHPKRFWWNQQGCNTLVGGESKSEC